MAGNVLEDRQHAAVEQAGAGRPRQCATHAGSQPKARSPMTSWPCGWRTSSTGAQSTLMPRSASSAAISRALSQLASTRPALVDGRRAADPLRRRCRPPMRRLEPLHPAAFLVDQHRRIGAADDGAQALDQGADLRRLGTVAGEQDEAERIGLGEEPAFLARRARGRPARRSPPAAQPGRHQACGSCSGLGTDDDARDAAAGERTAQRPRLGLVGQRPGAQPVEGAAVAQVGARHVGARLASRSAFLPFSLAHAPLTSSVERPENSCTWKPPRARSSALVGRSWRTAARPVPAPSAALPPSPASRPGSSAAASAATGSRSAGDARRRRGHAGRRRAGGRRFLRTAAAGWRLDHLRCQDRGRHGRRRRVSDAAASSAVRARAAGARPAACRRCSAGDRPACRDSGASAPPGFSGETLNGCSCALISGASAGVAPPGRCPDARAMPPRRRPAGSARRSRRTGESAAAARSPVPAG